VCKKTLFPAGLHFRLNLKSRLPEAVFIIPGNSTVCNGGFSITQREVLQIIRNKEVYGFSSGLHLSLEFRGNVRSAFYALARREPLIIEIGKGIEQKDNSQSNDYFVLKGVVFPVAKCKKQSK